MFFNNKVSDEITDFFFAKNSTISIVVYDIKGKEVFRIIDNKYYLKGNYSIYRDGNNVYDHKVSSGVYFYSILQDSKPINTKSRILIK